MKIKVLVIAPYQGLKELIKSMQSELSNFDITVEQGDLEESIASLKKYQIEEFDFIISRGGTASFLKKHSPIPVIEIQVSGFDILRILTLLKGYQSKIEMIGFSNVIQNFESVSSLIDINLSYTVIQHSQEVEQTIKRAKSKGVKIIVGDAITVRLANQAGLQGVLITSGRESVIEAFFMAKKMYKAMSKLILETKLYQNMLNKLDNGLAIIDDQGLIRFANSFFRKSFGLDEKGLNKIPLYEKHPYLKRIIELAIEGTAINHQLQINHLEQKYNILSGPLEIEQDMEQLYYLELNREHSYEKNDGVKIVYLQKPTVLLPKLIISEKIYNQAVSIAREKLVSQEPITILGEKGTGKGLFINSLIDSNKNPWAEVVEIKINQANVKTFNQLIKILMNEDNRTIVHIEGIDRTSLSLQRKLYNNLHNIKAQLVFSFNENPESFNNNNLKLEKDFFNILQDKYIYFPPLRKRKDELDEHIQSFIVQYNEMYGKQVVGLRPKVLKALHGHHWYGNFSELKEYIRNFVMNSDGEFIEEEALIMLNTNNLPNNQGINLGEAYIDLTQPLEKIEGDIIKVILEQENMNQSKTAKRLGINRATLWRKLKNEDN